MAAIKIKLVVDRSRNHVLFADAGSDFVDVLLTFLTLPLSAVQLTAGTSSPGCLSNLCDSVDRLREAELLKVEACHGMLLRPTHNDEFGYNRSNCSRCTTFVEKHLAPQGQSKNCRCWEVLMARLVHVYNETPRKEIFCNCKERFVVSDDWVIKQASTSTVVSFLRELGADSIGDGYEEVEVDVGWAEVVSLLKACVSSVTIFTDVFIAKGTDQAVLPALAKRSLLTIHKLQYQETSDHPTGSTSHPHVFIKLFYDRQDRKVMYVECKHDFVDLLLSFLTYPMGCIVKNLAGTSDVRASFNNLYRSAASLDAAGFLTGRSFGDKKTLLDPSIAPFKMHRDCSERAVAEW